MARYSDPGGWLADLTAVETALRAVGIALPPGGRFAMFREYAGAYASGTLIAASLSRADLRVALEAFRDFAELSLICSRLLPSDDVALLGKLRIAIAGPAMPESEGESLARDIQFELYVASLFREATVPTAFREPDLHATLLGVDLGVAAKRIKSLDKLQRRLKDGGDQLSAAGLRGIVAVNLDLAFALTHFVAEGVSVSQLEHGLPQLAMQFAEGLRKETVRATSSRGAIVGVLYCIALPCVVASQNQLGRFATVFPRTIGANATPDEDRAMQELGRLLTAAVVPV